MLRMRKERVIAPHHNIVDPKPDHATHALDASAAPAPARKRLAFVIAHLGPGGAQRVAVNAANAFVERGHEVHVIVLGLDQTAYVLDSRVVVHHCSRTKSVSAAPQLESDTGDALSLESDPLLPERTMTAPEDVRAGPVAAYLKPVIVPIVVSVSHNVRLAARSLLTQVAFTVELVRRVGLLRQRLKATKPDAVLSFLTQTNILTVLATRGLGTRTVISERNDPRLQRHRPRVELLRRLVYRRADIVTANSRGALSALEGFVPKRKLAFLPNPLALPASIEVARLDAPTIITVGRLVEQKGLDVLLAAWAKAVPRLPGWRLAMVGDGPLRGELEAQARTLGVGDSIDWHGHLSDPFPLLRAAKFFVLTSRFEGTPNALLEAMACGLPGVVSNASPGPCELVGEDESAGLIVPVEDSGATADAIVKLASDEPLRQRLAGGARERASEHEADRALDVWLKLLRCE